MKFLTWLAHFAIGALLVIVTPYFVISLCIAYFKATGVLVEGGQMYFDLRTPTWAGLLGFQVACVAIIGGGFVLRRRLRADAGN